MVLGFGLGARLSFRSQAYDLDRQTHKQALTLLKEIPRPFQPDAKPWTRTPYPFNLAWALSLLGWGLGLRLRGLGFRAWGLRIWASKESQLIDSLAVEQHTP